jgi:RHS repeat-associated protein
MKYKLTFALAAFMTSTAFAGFQAPLPEFKNEKQLAEWRAERASEATGQGYATEEAAFYTGKPYLASSGSYAFRYRSYSPKMARWTSEDPSGFPDGANNFLYVGNSSLNAFDPTGLAKMTSLTGTTIWYNDEPRPLTKTEQFSDYYDDVNLKPTDFNGFLSQFNSASEGATITLPYEHNFGDAYAAGRVAFELYGSISIGAYGDKYFVGTITLRDDIFNFDSRPWGDRTVPNEILTWILANTAFNPKYGGSEFTLTFSGSKDVSYE